MSAGFKEKVKKILENFTEPSTAERMRSEIGLLLDTGINSFERLMAVATDAHANHELRSVACWLLGRIKNKRGAQALLSAFEDPKLRWEAARSLGLLHCRKANRKLIHNIVCTADTDTRKASVYALGASREERALQPILRILSDETEESELRGYAAEALGLLGQSDAVVPLISALRDESVNVRFWAAYALGQLRDKRAISELEALAATDDAVLEGWWSVRQEALESIEFIRENAGW